MRIEGVVSVYLRNGGNYLLMKRAENRRFFPGFWANIGGHMEEGEMTDPERACLRELFEETGISADKVSSLKLRYICVAPREGYFAIHYMYFGETTETAIVQTDEGEIYWVPEKAVLEKGFTPVMHRLLEHYFKHALDNDTVYLFNENQNSIEILA